MAWSSLRASRWRSTLTMMGIIIGVSSVVTIASLGEGLKRQFIGQIDQLGDNVLTVRSGKIITKNSGGKIAGINPLALLNASTLTEEDQAAIKKIPSTKLVAPMSFVTNTANYEDKELNNCYVVGTNSDLEKLLAAKVTYGSFLKPDDINNNYAVIGPAVAEKLLGEFNPVGQSITILGQQFLIRGVTDSVAGGVLSTTGIDLNYAIFIPSQAGRNITAGRAQIAQFLVKMDGKPDFDANISQLKHNLLTNHRGQEDFTILRQAELLNISDNIVNLATGFIIGIAAISLLVGGIGIMNIMLVSVSERMREIGIRKAVGATNRQILSQFVIEGALLSVSGGTVGILVSIAFNFLLRIYTNFKPVVTITIIVVAAGVSIAIGIIFTLAPAFKAARKMPIDALRNE